MPKINKSLIENIMDQGNGNEQQQIHAAEIMSKIVCPKGRCIVDRSLIERLLPIVLKFLTSANFQLRKSGLNIIADILNNGANIELLLNAGVLLSIVDLLSSADDDNIVKQCLNCLLKFSDSFPVEVVELNAVPQLTHFLKSKTPQAAYKAASILKNTSNVKENIPAIIESGALQILINFFNSKNTDLIKEAFIIITNIADYDLAKCREVLGYGVLEIVNANFAAFKSYALKFIQKILYTEEEIDEIIDKCVILLIIKELNARSSAEIKTQAVDIVRIIIEKKPSYVYILVNKDNDIISSLTDLTESDSVALVIVVLTTIKNLVQLTGFQAIVEALKDSDVATKLQMLAEHENLVIRDLATSTLNLLTDNDEQRVNVKREIKDEMGDVQEDGAEHNILQREIKREIGVSKTLLNKIEKLSNNSITNQIEAIFTVGEIIINNPHITVDDLRMLLPLIIEFLNSDCEEVKQTSAQVLQLLVQACDSDDNKESIKFLINSEELIRCLKNLLASPVYAFTSLGFFKIFFDYYPEEILKHGVVGLVIKCLNHYKQPTHTRLAALGFLGNIINSKSRKVNLVKREKIVAVLLDNVNAGNVISFIVLTILNDIIHLYGSASIREKIEKGRFKIKSLLQNDEKQIQRLSKLILKFIDDAHVKRNIIKAEIIDDEEPKSFATDQISNNNQNRKRLFEEDSDENFLPRSQKRPRTSIIESVSEQSATPTFCLDDEINSFDDHSVVSFSTEQSEDVKPYPVAPPPPILLNLPEDEPTPEFGDIPVNEHFFRPFRYYPPSENFIQEICNLLSLPYKNENYNELYSQMNFQNMISFASTPASHISTTRKSGFDCIAVIFTGEENHATEIEKKLNEMFIENLNEFDKEKLKKVVCSKYLTEEHLEIVVKWLKCRILIYCYEEETWKRFGDWTSDDDEEVYAPIFLMGKKKDGDDFTYEIITSLND